MAFRELYRECRERFLVSTDLALRSQLTEFFDHQLVRNKRGYDGSEMLHIPIPNAALEEFQVMQKNE
jgi:origin recognition complex subunit 2